MKLQSNLVRVPLISHRHAALKITLLKHNSVRKEQWKNCPFEDSWGKCFIKCSIIVFDSNNMRCTCMSLVLPFSNCTSLFRNKFFKTSRKSCSKIMDLYIIIFLTNIVSIFYFIQFHLVTICWNINMWYNLHPQNTIFEKDFPFSRLLNKSLIYKFKKQSIT